MPDAIIKKYDATLINSSTGGYIHIPTSGTLRFVEENPMVEREDGQVHLSFYMSMLEDNLADEEEGDVVTSFYVVPADVEFSATNKFFCFSVVTAGENVLFVYEAN